MSESSTVMVDKCTSCEIQVQDRSVNTHDSYESHQSLLATIAEQKEKTSYLNDSVLWSSSPSAAMKMIMNRPFFDRNTIVLYV